MTAHALIAAAAERAAARFPWYARMLAEADATAADDAAVRIPVLRESDLATTYYAAEHDPGPGERVYATSGTTTGQRKRVRWPAHDHERYVDHRARLFRGLIGSECRTACADLGTGHAAASAREIFSVLGLESTEIDVSWPIERHVEVLEETRPDVLYTMPMILERVVSAGGPGYAPRWVMVLGDVAPPSWRAGIAGRLGMSAERIVDVFGSIEVGAIAYSDERLGAYLFHEHIVPEVIAPETPRADGAQALLVTSLERDGFPAVRYAAGDLVSDLFEVQVEGRQRWGYERHLGREGSEVKHGEMLSIPLIADAMARIAPGVAWTVRRDGHEVAIELEATAYTETAAAAVRDAVRTAHPAVDRMIRSGLVGDLRVEPKRFEEGTSKRPLSATSATG